MIRDKLWERIARRRLGLPKPLSQEHLDRLAREKRWADLKEEADKRTARAKQD
jgi:hypothetical protein